MPKTDQEPKRTTTTNWDVFNRLNLAVEEIVCHSYRPQHMADTSCHTRLLPKGDVLKAHVDSPCGGGFLVRARISNAPSPLWNELRDMGMEILDLKCDVCESRLPVDFIQIKNHMGVHKSKNRRNERGGTFWMTLVTEIPAVVSSDE